MLQRKSLEDDLFDSGVVGIVVVVVVVVIVVKVVFSSN